MTIKQVFDKHGLAYSPLLLSVVGYVVANMYHWPFHKVTQIEYGKPVLVRNYERSDLDKWVLLIVTHPDNQVRFWVNQFYAIFIGSTSRQKK